MNHPNPVLRRFNEGVYRACVVFTNLLLAVLVFNNLLEMGARGFFGTSIGWVFEVNLLTAIWLYFIGIYQVYFRRGDISVDVIMRRVAMRTQRWMAIAVGSLSLAFQTAAMMPLAERAVRILSIASARVPPSSASASFTNSFSPFWAAAVTAASSSFFSRRRRLMV